VRAKAAAGGPAEVGEKLSIVPSTLSGWRVAGGH
jgi:hypothetical protein